MPTSSVFPGMVVIVGQRIREDIPLSLVMLYQIKNNIQMTVS